MARYEDTVAAHEWRVPERYNIAADCCDKQPRDKLAMIHERFDGERRELTWGELQDLSNQAANLLAAQGVGRGDRVAVVLPATPETAAISPRASSRVGSGIRSSRTREHHGAGWRPRTLVDRCRPGRRCRS